MSPGFDPYLLWLSIRDPERPPNYYRLLGVELFEPDRDVIRHAYERRSRYVQLFLEGPYKREAERILQELAAAQACLLDPRKRAAYDQALQRQLGVSWAAPAGPVVPPKQKQWPVLLQEENLWPWRIAVVCLLLLVAVLFVLVVNAGRRVQKQIELARRIAPGPREDTEQASSLGSETAGGGETIRPSETGEESTAARPSAEQPQTPTTFADTSQPAANTPEESAEPSTEQMTQPAEQQPSVEQGVAQQPVQPAEPSETQPAAPSSGPRSGQEAVGQVAEQSSLQEPTAQQPVASETQPANVTPKLLPAPQGPELEAALARVEVQFIEPVKTSSDRRQWTQLTKQLLSWADKQQQPAEAFAGLKWALHAAVQSGQSALIEQVVKKLCGRFDVSRGDVLVEALVPAVEMPFDTQARADLAFYALQQAEELAGGDDFGAAKQLVEVARTLALRAKESATARRASQLRDLLPQLEAEYQTAQQALSLLQEQPDNEQAHLIVGSYLCFVRLKPKWQEGFEHLAKGADPALKQMAEQELQLAATGQQLTAQQMLQLAEGWDEVAKGAREELRRGVVARAVYWYRQALPGLRGFTKLRIEKRLAELVEQLKD